MKKFLAALIALAMVTTFAISTTNATQEKADQTGKKCSDCHNKKGSDGKNAGPKKNHPK